MSRAEAVAAILWVGVTLYAVFGGADFGAGVWQLLARRDREGDRVRARITRSLGPVWEANHVWLIFVLVVLWTGFPDAFAAVMSTLYIPLALAALGIVLRGAGFAFGKELAGLGRRTAGDVFALSSLLTPFFMGTVVGAVASGRVPPPPETGDPLSSWVTPLSVAIGVMFVASGAYLAAVFLVADARHAGERETERYFRHRALWAALVAGFAAAVGVVALRADARFFYDGLTSEGIPLVVISAACGLAALALLARGAGRGTRPLAVGAVVAVIWGWAVAQHPFLLPQSLTIDAGAGVGPALTALIVVFGAALVVVIPALALLYSLAQRRLLE